MPEREIQSPISRRGSRVGSPQPMSPGSRSAPSRGDNVAEKPVAEDARRRKPAAKPPRPEPED
jgi:hypothetical protein